MLTGLRKGAKIASSLVVPPSLLKQESAMQRFAKFFVFFSPKPPGMEGDNQTSPIIMSCISSLASYVKGQNKSHADKSQQPTLGSSIALRLI